ncbi:MAG: hypothetical protein ACYC55_09740 [Candidatus Geothermincolia bacterium]
MDKSSRLFRCIAPLAVLFMAAALSLAGPAGTQSAEAAVTGWQAQTISEAGLPFWDVSAVDAQHAYAAAQAEDGHVMSTDDGGATWVWERNLPGG